MRALRQCARSHRVEIFNSLWEDLLTFTYMAMQESSDPAVANRILDEALRLGGGRMHHSRLLERACEFGLLQYVLHNLCSLPPLARTQVAEEIFPHALLPNPISGEFSPQLVTYLLSLGVDVNKSTASKTDPKLVRSTSTKSVLVDEELDDSEESDDSEHPTYPLATPSIIEETKTVISNFKKQLDQGRLSSSQKGLSEVVTLLKANGADIALPVSTPTSLQMPRKRAIKGSFNSWTAGGGIRFSFVDSPNKQIREER